MADIPIVALREVLGLPSDTHIDVVIRNATDKTREQAILYEELERKLGVAQAALAHHQPGGEGAAQEQQEPDFTAALALLLEVAEASGLTCEVTVAKARA